MKIDIYHKGKILDSYGFGDLEIDLEETDENARDKVLKKVQWRSTNEYDFEYGIGGVIWDRYFKIEEIDFHWDSGFIKVNVKEVNEFI